MDFGGATVSGSVISAVSRSRIVFHQISRCLVMPAILVSCYGSYLNQGVWAQETPPAVEPPPALETGSRPVQEKPAQEKPAQETVAPSPDSVTPESATINPDKSRTPLLQVMDKAPIAHARDLSVAFRAASEKVLPSVVTILGQTKDIDPTQQALGFADEGDPSIYDSVGSGVIVDSSGLIITNNHVVAEAKRVLVRLYDGREIIAEDIR